MSDLTALQTQFQNYVTHKDDEILTAVVGTERVSKEIRLSIYENAYRMRLIEALASSYPILQRYLGLKSFNQLCDNYIDAFPSSYRSIRWFGEQLPSFLTSLSTYAKLPHLSELAQWEWINGLVFDAADAPVFALAEMALISPDQWAAMTFRMHPSLHRLTLSWNVVEIWHDRLDKKPMQYEKPLSWILWRKAFIPQFTSLLPDESLALSVIQQGRTFGALCESLCEFVTDQEAPFRAASLLKGWISEGLIESVIVNELDCEPRA